MTQHPYGQQKHGIRILVGVSGGMDSAVAAALLKTQGYDVHALFVRLSDPSTSDGVSSDVFRCCSVPDIQATRRFCEAKGIPLHEHDASELFGEAVVDDLVHERLQARTPNPCSRCLQDVIMRTLYRKAGEGGFAIIATGHYAQVHIEGGSGTARLHEAVDPTCDQSAYFFWMGQEELKRTLFPLGGLTRSMVEKLAAELGIPEDRIRRGQVSSQRSMCATAFDDYRRFVEARAAPTLLGRGGVIRTADGTIAGEHQGLYAYSVGQKKGLEIRGSDSDKYAVVDADPVHNTLIVGGESNLATKTLLLTRINWLRPLSGIREIRCQARFMPEPARHACRVMLFENQTVRLELEEAVRMPGAGKLVVLSDKTEVLGGGYVSRLGPEAGHLAAPGENQAPGKGSA